MNPRLSELRFRVRPIITPLVCALALIYFAYHGVQGERGLLAWIERSAEIETYRASAAEVAAERARLAHRVSLLRPESLDLDLLEERARILLNRGHADDIVILEGPLATPLRTN